MPRQKIYRSILLPMFDPRPNGSNDNNNLNYLTTELEEFLNEWIAQVETNDPIIPYRIFKDFSDDF